MIFRPLATTVAMVEFVWMTFRSPTVRVCQLFYITAVDFCTVRTHTHAHTQTHTENSSKTRNRDQTRSNLGTTRSYVTVESNPSLTPVPSHTYSGHSNSSGEARVAIKMNSAHEGRESAIIEESENSDPDQL